MTSGARPGASRASLLAYGSATAVIAADQLSKLWVLNGLSLPDRGPLELLPFLSLNMVWNEGVSFNLLQDGETWARWGLALFSGLVAVMLILWARKVQRPLLAAALGLVIGGALGNLIDRVRFGAVVDFIDVSRLGFFPWVFNVADSAITVGVILLVLDSLLPRKPAVGRALRAPQ